MADVDPGLLVVGGTLLLPPPRAELARRCVLPDDLRAWFSVLDEDVSSSASSVCSVYGGGDEDGPLCGGRAFDDPWYEGEGDTIPEALLDEVRELNRCGRDGLGVLFLGSGK